MMINYHPFVIKSLEQFVCHPSSKIGDYIEIMIFRLYLFNNVQSQIRNSSNGAFGA